MTLGKALDAIVSGIAGIDARLSGDDSSLRTPWEEVKEQVQHGLTPHWPVYLATIRQFVDGFVMELAQDERDRLMSALKCSNPEALQRRLVQRLLARAKKERIQYAPFDFQYFCYALLDFTVYGEVLERNGMSQCYARVFSVAAPTGEHGTVNCSDIESILSRQQFERARTLGWPVEPR
jgi:hypothetical protein